MTWYRKTVIRILLVVAWLIEEDTAARDEIRTLANHINVWAPKDDEV